MSEARLSPRLRSIRPALLASLPLLASASCARGVLPTKPPTVQSMVGADAAPLVVDWPAGPRSDLEVAAHDGVAVVRVEADKISILPGCKLDGSYRFVGVTTKEQLIRFDDAGDLAANLPLRGAALAGEIGGELGATTSLDVALVTIGKRRTARAAAARSALRGDDCKGATHFVRGYDVGAFVLATSAKENASTVVSLFTAKASYARNTSKSIHEADGDLAECKKGTPDDPAPPAQCGAPLRLELKAIDNDDKLVAASCPGDLVRAGGACTSKAKASAKAIVYECKPGDAAECKAQCDAGNAASCGHWAERALHASDATPDFASIAKAAAKGCEGGAERACIVQGELLQYGHGVAVDYDAAAKVYDRACSAGEALGCFRQAVLYDRRPGLAKDYAKASALYDRACRAGEVDGCNNLGALALTGKGQKADAAKARSIYEDACKNGSGVACGNLGDLLADGTGGPKDVTRAAELWSRACAVSGAHCVRLGDALSGAGALPKDAVKSLEAYQAGVKILSAQCSLGIAERCDDLAWLFHDGHATQRDDAQALAYVKKGCDLGSPAACNDLGLFFENGWGTPVDKNAARAKYAESCDAGVDDACVAQGLLLLDNDPSRAAIFAKACESGSLPGCYHSAREKRCALETGDAATLMSDTCAKGYARACSYAGRSLARRSEAAIFDAVVAKGCDPAAPAACGPGAERAFAMSAKVEALLGKGCEGGDVKGCGALASLLATKPGAKSDDRERASVLAKRACDGGVATACRTLGELAAKGVGAAGEASARFQKACDSGDLVSCVRVAEPLMQTDPGRAGSLLAKTCDISGFAASELMKAIVDHVTTRAPAEQAATIGGSRKQALGDLSGVGSASLGAMGSSSASGVRGDVASSNVDLREQQLAERRADLEDAGELANEGADSGCVPLGEMHEKGLGFLKNDNAAEAYYALACTRGDGRGCTRFGMRMEKTTKDGATVRAVYDLACELRDGDGCLHLGIADEAARGKDLREEASTSYASACELGSAEGCLRGGTAKSRSFDTFDEAVDLFEKGCTLNEPKACVLAARIYDRGWKGRSSDKSHAASLRASACRLGDKTACAK